MLPLHVREIIEEMREERIMGASYLARRGAEAYLKLAEILEGEELLNALEELAGEIRAVNPTMASLHNLTEFIKPSPDREFVRSKAFEFIRLSEEAKREIGNIGSELIDEGDVIITHSFSSTVLEIFKVARRKGKHFKVIITESAPDYEGMALARELESIGVPFEIITDAQMGFFAKNTTFALVGADNVTRDGSVINKAGTYLLSLACHDNGVPLYAAAESFKIHPKLRAEEVEIVERRFKRNHFLIRNYLFDITPWRYIRGIITEFGILVPPKEL